MSEPDHAAVEKRAKEILKREHPKDLIWDNQFTARKSLGSNTVLHLNNEERAQYMARAQEELKKEKSPK